MKTCEYGGELFTAARSHPWTSAVSNAAFRYYDLLASPELIRTSLEDFVPWAHYPAVERFYALLEWLHGTGSLLESNDCELSAPHPNTNPQIRATLACSGRVMLLFRDLPRNVASDDLAALTYAFHCALAPVDPDFERGIVGTTLVPVRYVSLPFTKKAQQGRQLMLSFWAWGDSEPDVMENLDRLMTHLAQALRAVAGSPA